MTVVPMCKVYSESTVDSPLSRPPRNWGQNRWINRDQRLGQINKGASQHSIFR